MIHFTQVNNGVQENTATTGTDDRSSDLANSKSKILGLSKKLIMRICAELQIGDPMGDKRLIFIWRNHLVEKLSLEHLEQFNRVLLESTMPKKRKRNGDDDYIDGNSIQVSQVKKLKKNEHNEVSEYRTGNVEEGKISSINRFTCLPLAVTRPEDSQFIHTQIVRNEDVMKQPDIGSIVGSLYNFVEEKGTKLFFRKNVFDNPVGILLGSFFKDRELRIVLNPLNIFDSVSKYFKNDIGFDVFFEIRRFAVNGIGNIIPKGILDPIVFVNVVEKKDVTLFLELSTGEGTLRNEMTFIVHSKSMPLSNVLDMFCKQIVGLESNDYILVSQMGGKTIQFDPDISLSNNLIRYSFDYEKVVTLKVFVKRKYPNSLTNISFIFNELTLTISSSPDQKLSEACSVFCKKMGVEYSRVILSHKGRNLSLEDTILQNKIVNNDKIVAVLK